MWDALHNPTINTPRLERAGIIPPNPQDWMPVLWYDQGSFQMLDIILEDAEIQGFRVVLRFDRKK
jgi:hypothetical protein